MSERTNPSVEGMKPLPYSTHQVWLCHSTPVTCPALASCPGLPSQLWLFTTAAKKAEREGLGTRLGNYTSRTADEDVAIGCGPTNAVQHGHAVKTSLKVVGGYIYNSVIVMIMRCTMTESKDVIRLRAHRARATDVPSQASIG